MWFFFPYDVSGEERDTVNMKNIKYFLCVCTYKTMNVSEYAALAFAVYARDDPEKALQKITDYSGGKYKGDDYTVLDHDEDYMVFKRKSDGGIILSCRGTNGVDDIIPDVLIAVGMLRSHPRGQEVLNAARRYKQIDRDMVVTGHSLGGRLASLVGETEGVLAVTFNQGSSPVDSNPLVVGLKTRLSGYKYNNVIHFTTGFDVASTTEALMQNYHTFVVSPPSYVNLLSNHSLSAFRDLDDSKYREFIQKQRERLKVDVFVEAGIKPIGDRESETEFKDRVSRAGTKKAGEVESGPQSRGDTFIGCDNVTVCVLRKRKASTLDTVPVVSGGSSLQSVM